MAFATYPSLAGRSVLVTGGASGIGADIVRAFAGQRARVAFVDILDAEARAVAAETGAVWRHCDITDIAALQAAIAGLAAEVGPFTVLVNNAASDKRETVAEVTVADWDLSQAINLRPQFFAAQAVAPGMRAAGGGAIVNLSSIAWHGGGGGMLPYTTAKAGVLGLTFALAQALGPDGIRVNAVEPGAVMTERQRRDWYPTEEQVRAITSRQAVQGEVTGGDIARMVLFLASEDARMITKQSFVVDAGLR